MIEFQGQAWASARYNLLAKVGLYGELHPKRDVRGVLIFSEEGDDAGAPPVAVPSLFTVAYLDGLLPKWLEREPSNPFVAVFMPLIVKSDEDLRANAPKAWQAIQTAPLESGDPCDPGAHSGILAV